MPAPPKAAPDGVPHAPESPLETDYLVLGGGTAGIVVATRLSELTGGSVALV